MPRLAGRSIRAAVLRRAFAWGMLAAVTASGWMVFPRLLSSPPATPVERRWHLLVEDIDVATTDPNGHLQRRLQADELRRAGRDTKSDLLRPRLTVFPADGAPWRFTAERGEVSPDRENVYLPGPVQGRGGEGGSLVVDSRDVRIAVAEGYGESPERSVVAAPGFEVRGRGVRFSLGDGRVELLSEVRGVFEPQR